jgi:hypothetical protein
MKNYLVALKSEIDSNLAERAALKGDTLATRANLSQQTYPF